MKDSLINKYEKMQYRWKLILAISINIALLYCGIGYLLLMNVEPSSRTCDVLIAGMYALIIWVFFTGLKLSKIQQDIKKNCTLNEALNTELNNINRYKSISYGFATIVFTGLILNMIINYYDISARFALIVVMLAGGETALISWLILNRPHGYGKN